MDLAASPDHVRRCLEQFERRTASALRVLTGQPPWVELGALRVLHPIEDIVAGLFRRIIELGQTLGLDHSRTSLTQPISAVFTSRLLASLELRMHRICLVAAAVLGFGAVVAAAD